MSRSTLLYFLPILACLLFFLIAQHVLSIPQAYGFTMSNGDYILELGGMNSFAGSAEGSGKKLNFASGESGQSVAVGNTTKVKLGFAFIHPLRAFSFTVSEPLIDFGILSPTNPVIRNNILTVDNGSAQGYSVTASENHPLQTGTSGQVIPDSTCDNGACTELASAVWLNTLTYGFGYRCDPITVPECADGFLNKDSYKQFSDEGKLEPAQAVMAGTTRGSNKQVKITYKVNIPGSQPAGSYTNTITYIAIPSF